MKRILLTGGRGMLGRTIVKELSEKFEIIPSDLPEADITNPTQFDFVLKKYQPDTVIHCAAMTAVDKCESEIDFAYKLNAFGTANVAAACNRNHIRLIAISTDYVFQGDSQIPYTEFDQANGGNTIYGKSKFAGEQAIRTLCPNHVICRISWLYGYGGPSFVHAMLKLADGTRPALKVVADQIGNPTSAIAVAHHLALFLEHPELAGLYHLTCEGEASWYDFAVEIFKQCKISQQVIPCTTKEFPRPAPRPLNSRLEKMMLRLAGLPPMPNWKDALSDFLKKENF